jgi:hypothetical protein
MSAFRIGPVLAQRHGMAWHITRETWLRIARDETEAEIFARQMATDWGAPLDSSDRVDLYESE